LRYQVKIWEQYLKQNPSAANLPVIIPLVLYHGLEKWNIGTRFSDLILDPEEELKTYIPDFSYLLYDLSDYSDEQIRGAALMRAALLLLKYIYHPDLAIYLRRIFPLLKELSRPGQGLSSLESIIRYIFNVSDRVSVDELKEMIENNLTKKNEEVIMTIAEQLVQQGLQQGLQQAILDVLEARFSDIPLSLREKLSGISDRTILKDLLKKAAVVPSASELEKKIPAGASNLS